MYEKRIDELDILRGLSVMGMILVITPGAWGINYSWLNHAEWEGVVFVDMIAPAFLFCVGFSIPLALKKRVESSQSSLGIVRYIVQRGALLIILGVVLNWTRNFDVSDLRIPGVLQRIGFTYVLVALLIFCIGRTGGVPQFTPSVKYLIAITGVFLFLMWCLFYFVPVPGFGSNQFSSEGSWSSYIDITIFGDQHMWIWGKTNGEVTYDPDGLIVSVATCGNVVIGAVIGLLYQYKSPWYSCGRLAMIGFGLLVLGFSFSVVCPIVKKLWTSSFVLISSGASLLSYAFIASVKRSMSKIKLSRILFVFGSNALLAFSFAWLCLMWLLDIPLVENEHGELSLRALGFNFLSSFIPWPALASLMFGLSYMGVLYLGLAYMYNKRWFVRI